ncbi:MAG: hypothetical protein AAF602_06580 [Myxococcota bacterium]
MTGVGRSFGGLAVAAMLTGCIVEVGGGEREWRFVDPPEVMAEVSNGDIRVRSALDDELLARWDGGGFGDNARPDVVELADGTIRIDADGGLAGGGTMELEVPDGTALDLTVDRGSIDVELDAPASIYACAGAGRVGITVPPGPYRLELGAGIGVIDNGIVDDPTAPYTLEVCVGAGEVELRER